MKHTGVTLLVVALPVLIHAACKSPGSGSGGEGAGSADGGAGVDSPPGSLGASGSPHQGAETTGGAGSADHAGESAGGERPSGEAPVGGRASGEGAGGARDCDDAADVRHQNGYPVRSDGSYGGDGSLTTIPLGGLLGLPSDAVVGTSGELWVARAGLERVRVIETETVEGASTQPNLTVEITSFPHQAKCLAATPDGNVWYTQYQTDAVLRMSPCGELTTFKTPTAKSQPYGIAADGEGNIWFTEKDAGQIGVINSKGEVTEFPLPPCDSCDLVSPPAHQAPTSITLGPDGLMWFLAGYTVGTIDKNGTITQRYNPTAISVQICHAIVTGPDGNVWVGYERFDAEDQNMTIFPLDHAAIVNVPHPIASGPDDALWFLEDADKVTRLSITGEASRPYRVPGLTSAAIALGADQRLWVVTGQTLSRLEPQQQP